MVCLFAVSRERVVPFQCPVGVRLDVASGITSVYPPSGRCSVFPLLSPSKTKWSELFCRAGRSVFSGWLSIFVFGCSAMGRWDDGNFPVHFRLLDRAGGRSDGRQRRDMADRYERSKGQREVRKCIVVKVSMLIQNIVVKGFWGQYLRERVYVII